MPTSSTALDGILANNGLALPGSTGAVAGLPPAIATNSNLPPGIKVDPQEALEVIDDQKDRFEGDDPATARPEIDFSSGKAGSTMRGKESSDRLKGTENRDVLKGNGGNDDLKGNGGNDQISGDKGNDKADGGKGNDKLEGGQGKDRLTGGQGNDVLVGGTDADILITGTGSDVCRYNALEEAGDVILGFDLMDDVIDLRGILALNPELGTKRVDKLFEDGNIRWEAAGSGTKVLVDLDGTAGSGQAVAIALLKGFPATELSPANFVVR
jgi:Ca2+-binding RTX toxin-like protein